jgi:hypothetical protein
MIKIEVSDKGVFLACPKNDTIIQKAHHLKAKWDPDKKVWGFDRRDEANVRAVCKKVFGWDGLGNPALVDLRLNVNKMIGGSKRSLEICGITVCYRPGRDQPVEFASNACLITGGFKGHHAGSMKYPTLDEPKPNTVIELRDLPEPMAEMALAEWDDACIRRARTEAPKPEPLSGDPEWWKQLDTMTDEQKSTVVALVKRLGILVPNWFTAAQVETIIGQTIGTDEWEHFLSWIDGTEWANELSNHVRTLWSDFKAEQK